MAFYSDKHGIFRVNLPSTGSGEALTQFGRAMQELDIQIICANTPQAKGRVERVNQTLQDRLVKEMRLRDISNMADLNQRFAIEPRSSVNAHRPLTTKDDLARILTWQESLTLSKNLTIQFEKVVYQIQTQRPTYAMRQAVVTVCKNTHQNITIRYKGKSLPFTIFHKQAKQSEVVHAKNLNHILLPHKPAPDHPWRKGFATPLSKRRTVSPAPAGDISTLENK